MKVLGVNALFHDPAAALVVDGVTVAAAEEERFSRRKHGKRPVPFSAWELPEQSMKWCLEYAGIEPADLDLVGYSFDPRLADPAAELGLDDPFDDIRLRYAELAPGFLAEALTGLDPKKVRFVAHHLAHGASAALAAPFADSDVLVLDGRGECRSHLAGTYRDGRFHELAGQRLPHSLGLLYEDLTAHLGFMRSSDEYKVMALASYGKPRFYEVLRELVHERADGGFDAVIPDWTGFCPRRSADESLEESHADLASSVQLVVEDTLLELARWLQGRTGNTGLSLAGGVALNCVANSRLHDEGPYDRIFVQPAAGDAGTALGAALQLGFDNGEALSAFPGADLGRGWSDAEIEECLNRANIGYERPNDISEAVAEALVRNEIVAWFQGRSEFGPRALGRRSLLAHPGHRSNLERLNDVKGREQFRPVAPMVLADRADEIFSRGPLPSPYMLFVHDVARRWRDRIPAVVHVDGTARVQTVEARAEPLLARMLTLFERATGLPVVVNTSLNTAGRPMVDDPRDALECFGSTPIDLLAIGSFVVRRRQAW